MAMLTLALVTANIENVQSDSESLSSDKVEQNSATEISTDSEFDHDEIIRETPKIFIDDTHLRKPTKVHVKSTIITPSSGQKYHTATPVFVAQTKGGSYLQKYQPHNQPLQPQFKPLVQVDPSVLCSNRMPLENPRPGDYFLNKTASTEGIASKKSLELKKRYLLGEQANGNKIQKSGSTSVLDSKIRSFHSNISECQKLLNPGNDKTSRTKTFLDQTKLGKTSSSDTTNVTPSATGNILKDLKVEITIQKASSNASTDNEKENLFVNSKNELNKGMEYSETVNSTLVESLGKKSPTTPTNNQKVIETIDLVTPEKKIPIIDLTQVEIPTKMLESNAEFIKHIEVLGTQNGTTVENCCQLLNTDSNKIIDLTCHSPVESDKTVIEGVKPDISIDVKECIPDIIEHIEGCDGLISVSKNQNLSSPNSDEQHRLLSYSYDEEKKDSPEKLVALDNESHDLQIEVPNIPWNTRKPDNSSTNSLSSCSSNTSSIEDIQHFILESTTSPDTQTANGLGVHQVPRLEVHDTSGELMQIDSLMIIDGRYIGDPEDLKLLEIPEGLIIPELPAIQTSEVEDEPDIEPVTATPEPAEGTIIEAEDPETLPLSDSRQPIMQPFDLKFDSRNENKVETLKNLPLIVEQAGTDSCKAVKPLTLNLKNAHKSTENPTTPTMNAATPKSPLIDNDKTPTAALVSRGSDSETEATGTGQVLTETELSDWTADDCISENFIDIEFVLNSNKGTIKRNKKGGKKKVLSAYKELSMRKPSSKVATDCQKIAPVAEFEGILRNLDIDEIEFMDTGSEGSCADAYSATNSAMLRNRGYMEFIETTPKKIPSHKTTENVQKLKDPLSVNKYKEIPTKRDEVLGIDYIEQGAYIMTSGNSLHDLLKTPVNEQPILSISVDRSERSSLSQPQITLSQSLTDSSTLNDLEDDSLGVVTNSGANTKTTTDESEALTVVTSPLDSSSPKIAEVFVSKGIPSTPSSSDKNPKTSTLSTYSPTTASTASFSNTTSPRLSAAQEKIGTAVATKIESVSIHQPTSDEICYEDYVRALQQKITQISNARDSLDTRKQRRKSSKGEAPLATFSSDTQTVIEQQIRTASGESSSQSLTPPRLEAAATSIKGIEDVPESSTWLAQLHKVPEIPTLTSRLEEITKERTKQKDLIHDLVMDKLQSKKQLNAEKRLHRSRQRSMLAAGGCGYTSGSSLSPTPKLAAASTTTDTNCTSQAHYHVSTSAPTAPKERPTLKEHSSSSSFKENKPLQKSSSYVAAYCTDSTISPPCSAAYTQRPFSEHLDAEQLDALECYKLVKTPSFSYAMSASRRNLNSEQPNKEDKKQISNSTLFATPTAPLHGNRERSISGCSLISPTLNVNEEHLDVGVSVISTEKLRTEARARARLKSNNELGLSPEEKILLLRKRLNLENIVPMETRQNYAKSAERDVTHGRSGYDLKMSSSKSVNDLVTAAPFSGKIHGYAADENSNTTQSAVMADFTSDPNLLLSSTTAQTAIVKPSKGDDKITRRQKDPERRKSIIQSLSNFFHMGNGSSGANGGKNSSSNSGSAANSAQPERPGTCGSSTTSSSVEGVFSRFRIAPKLKEKSKSCFDMRSSGFGDKDAAPTVSVTSRDNTISTTTNIPTPTKNTHYERSSSQDCILNTQTNNDSSHRYSNTTKQSNYSHNQHQHHHHHHHHHHRYHNNNNNGNKQRLDSSASAKHFASSPQLFVNPFTVVTPDELTPPPIPPLPLHYQRSDDESYATETREQKKQRSISKAVRQAELKRLRIAQEIQREQEEIEVQLKELEARGVLIEKALRGEGQHVDSLESSNLIGANDEKLLKQLLEIWRNITQLKKRDEELSIRQQELQLEHRHAQLKEELNMRLSSSKLDKSSADVAAEGAILNEMLEIVAKRASLRPTTTTATSPSTTDKQMISKQHEASAVAVAASAAVNTDMEATNSAETTRSESLKLTAIDGAQSLEMNESHI